ncbi:MAG: hypothetical protein AAF741_13430, partial [Bacteroidota bacterium]
NVTVCEDTEIDLLDRVENPSSFTLSFHATQQEAIDNESPFSSTTLTPGVGTTTYHVRSTEASSGEDCFSVASFTVTVVSEPTVSTSNLTVCEDTEIDLLDRVENPSGFTLSFHATEQEAIDNESPFSSTTLTPIVGTTTYHVRSTEAASGEACFSVTSFEVTVRPNPSVTLEDITNCEGESLTFSPDFQSGANGVQSFQWQNNTSGIFQDLAGETSSNLFIPNANLASSGRQYRILVAEELNGLSCFAEDQATLTVNEAAISDAGEDQTICSTKDIELNATTNGTGSWSGGDGSFDDANSPNTIYRPAQDEIGQTVTLTWTTDDPDANGPCAAVSDQLSITILKVDCGSFPWDGE